MPKNRLLNVVQRARIIANSHGEMHYAVHQYRCWVRECCILSVRMLSPHEMKVTMGGGLLDCQRWNLLALSEFMTENIRLSVHLS